MEWKAIKLDLHLGRLEAPPAGGGVKLNESINLRGGRMAGGGGVES